MTPDIRWQQRFSNYCRVCDLLESAIIQQPTDLDIERLIPRFDTLEYYRKVLALKDAIVTKRNSPLFTTP